MPEYVKPNWTEERFQQFVEKNNLKPRFVEKRVTKAWAVRESGPIAAFTEEYEKRDGSIRTEYTVWSEDI